MKKLLDILLTMIRAVVHSELKEFYRSASKDRDAMQKNFAQIQKQIANLNVPKLHLDDHGWGVFSQTDEDGILHFLTTTLNLSQPKFLELGAGNFSECNFRGLVETGNGSGVFVDARKDLIHTLRRTVASYLGPALAVEAYITPDNVEQLVSDARKELGGLDLLSIDLDGNDYWVAERVDFSGIKVVVMEVNPGFGELSTVSVPRNDTFDRGSAHFSHLYWGTSISAYTRLMSARGFTLVGLSQKRFNAFFVTKEEVERSPVLGRMAEKLVVDFSRWRVREGRDRAGQLTYASSSEALRGFPDLPLVDVKTGATISIESLQLPTSG